ncbi:hypothetical protein [Leptothoe spongobia]|uniref:Uncharacterized protein n=1 Tax=Leptothoe spongobia TAU-MAC 1115 TaxID=1967444 RepID=A0A947DDM7_9CYAN|nr:hypothetical protein [Leptothoe spongobia]MBT9314414.1 hypothetical protein [Leptothoe spongobia TAU-MAC 1115]
MPFLPLFIVIGIFLATSKILQPNHHQHFQSASDDYNEQRLNQALIDYIARESRSKSNSRYGSQSNAKSGKKSLKSDKRR